MGRVRPGGVQAGRAANQLGRNARWRISMASGEFFSRAMKVFHLLKASSSHRLRDVFVSQQAFGDDDVRDGVDHRDVGAGLQLQVVVGVDVRGLHQIDFARVDDDEFGAGAEARLHGRCEDGMGVGGIRADHPG